MTGPPPTEEGLTEQGATEDGATEQAPPGSRRGVLRVVVRGLTLIAFVASVVFVAVAFADALDRTEGRTVPTVPVLVGAGSLVVIAHLFAAWAWVVLLPREVAWPGVRRTWFLSQLAKYVPGGLLQAAGQIGLTTALGVPGAVVTVRFLVMAGGFVLAGLAVGSSAAVVVDDLQPLVRVAVAAGVLGPVLLWRRVQAHGLGVARRLGLRRLEDVSLPEQRTTIISWVAQVLFMILQAMSFVLVLRSLDPSAGIASSLVVFPLAFAIGTLAVPVPSGLAVREAVLVGVLSGSPSELVLTAAIWQRVCAIAAEVLLAAGNEIVHRVRRL